uniref:Uncharacterized protein n=1 Tax=Panagrolaimus sp. ES5 TaxID=591445 RepID=A0AC34GBH9_9BILA
MTALTASFLLEQPFKNNNRNDLNLSSIFNGKREIKEHKLEFVEAGVLKPPELPPNVIKLVAGAQIANVVKLIGPQIPPGYVLPSSSG